MIRLSDTAFDPAQALASFNESAGGAGGVVSFAGFVRPMAGDDPVVSLFLQSHPRLTEAGISAALNAAHARWPLIAAHVIHRTGEIAAGEAIVFVATASAHRRAAFEAADFLMDHLKTEAVFWKKETRASGSHWIEPRSEDYADRARWQDEGA